MAEKWRPTICRRCGVKASKRCYVSTRGICSKCSDRAVRQSIEQMAAGEGPVHDRWAEAMTDGVLRRLGRIA